MTNKVYAMYQIQAVYKYEFNDKVNLLLACGLTEYHSKWRVNGVEPSWSRGVDSSKACMYGTVDDIERTWYLKDNTRLIKLQKNK